MPTCRATPALWSCEPPVIIEKHEKTPAGCRGLFAASSFAPVHPQQRAVSLFQFPKEVLILTAKNKPEAHQQHRRRGRFYVLANDSDPDGNATISIATVDTTSARGGSLSIETDDGGKQYIRYLPRQHYYGADSFTYKIKDDTGRTDTATVSINVTYYNYPPVLKNLNDESTPYQTNEDTETEIVFEVYDDFTELKGLSVQPSITANAGLIDSYGIREVDPLDPGRRVLWVKPAKDKNSYGGKLVEFQLRVGDGVKNATDIDEGDVLSLVAGSILPDRSVDEDGVTGTETGSVSFDSESGKWVFTPEVGFIGEVWYQYTVQDKFHDVYTYPATFDNPGYPNYPGVHENDVYDGQTTGWLKFQVGTSSIGPSIRRLPPIIAYAGQEMDDRTLVTKNVTANTNYTIDVEVVGGPVDPASIRIDGQGLPFSDTAAGPNPEHTFSFSLKPGVVGDGVVRVSITAGGITNSMSFRVTTHATNKPPVIASDPITASCVEGQAVEIDVIDLAGITDPEGQKLSFSDIATGGNINSDTVTIKGTGAGSKRPRGSEDVDDDIVYFDDVWCADGSATDITFSSTDPGGDITFKANASGWLELHYRVKSSFSNQVENDWKYSLAAGRVIYVYVPAQGDDSGLIPPRASGGWKEFTEDGGTGEIEITSWLFGEGSTNGSDNNPNLEFAGWTVNNNDGVLRGHRLDNVQCEKRTVDGKHRYFVTFKLVPDANNYTDAAGDMTATSLYPSVTFTVRNKSDLTAESGTPPRTATATATVRIKPVNDEPVIEGFTVQAEGIGDKLEGPVITAADNSGVLEAELADLERYEYATLRVKVTDPDYPTQAKCDSQIRLAMTSTNNLAVVADQAIITPPAGDGWWTVRFSGFTPGDTVLTLTAHDESGAGNQRLTQVKVKVTGANHPPKAEDYYAVFEEDKKASVTVFNDNSDQDGDPVEIVLESSYPGLPGRVSAEGDKIVFIPENDFCHTSELPLSLDPAQNVHDERPDWWKDGEQIKIAYKLRDAVKAESTTRYVYLHFNPVNDAPRFVGMQAEYAITEGIPGEFTFRVMDVDSVYDVLDEDTKEMFSCAFTDTDRIQSTEVTSVVKNDDGSYSVTVKVTPKPFQCHEDSDTPSILVLTARDDQDAQATVEVGLRINPVNDSPVLKDGYNDPLRFETNEDESITIDFSEFYTDPDGPHEPLYITSLDKNPQWGTVVYKDNKAVFTPNANYFTRDANDIDQWGSFTYTLADSTTGRASGTVKINILPVNDPPILKAMRYTCTEDNTLPIEDLFSGSYTSAAPVYDIDNARDELSITAAGVGSVAGGVTTPGATAKGGRVEIVSRDGKAWYLSYTPAPDFNGTDTFCYTVSDGQAHKGSATQVITITVTGEDDPPRGNFEDSPNWQEGVQEEMNAATPPTWEFEEDNTGSFKFMVWDPEGNTVLFTVEAQDFDAASSNCTTLAQLLPSGAITNTASGAVRTVHIAPAANKYGDFKLKFTLDDGTKKTEYTIPVSIKPVNDPPALAGQSWEMNEDATLAKQVLGSDVETPAAQLAYSHDTTKPGPAHGTVTVKPDGNFTYQPADNYFGNDEFYIKVTDKGATNTSDGPLSATAKISVTVKPVNDAPAAPSGLVADGPGYYKGGQPITIRWTAGSDSETAPAALAYELEYYNGSAWVSAGSRVTGSISASLAIPAVNTADFQYRVRVWDNNTTDLNLTGAPGAASSGWAYSPRYTVDSTAPTAAGYSYRVPAGYANAPDTEKMRFRVRAWSAGGMHSANWSAGGDILCDSTKPVITLAGSPIAYTAGNVSVDVTITANTTVTVTVVDACGNSQTASYVVGNIDKTPPTASLTAKSKNLGILENTSTNAPIIFTLQYGDAGVSGLVDRQYAVTDNAALPLGGWTNVAGTTQTVTRSDIGTYYVHLLATDGAGNETWRCYGPYDIANTIPKAKNLSYSVKEGGRVVIELSAVDEDAGDSIASYAVVPPGPDYGTLTPLGGNRYEYLHDGVDPVQDTSFTYYATDTRGEDSLPATVRIQVIPVNDPPEITNLPVTASMVWNTSLRLPADAFDPDNKFGELKFDIKTSNANILPLGRIQLGRTQDSLEERAGELVLLLRPLPGTFTTNRPVRVTLTATDPAGAKHSVYVDVTVEQKPLPPEAGDQYYFVVKDGAVEGEILAKTGAMGTGLSYQFGFPSDSTKCAFTAGGGADPAFRFEAGSSFANGDSLTVPVTITQANSDGSSGTRDITLHFRSEAVTTEKKENDEVVTLIPGLASGSPAGTELPGVKIESNDESILQPDRCRVVVQDNGQLYLYYSHEPYRYGRVTVTIETPNGTIEVPIVIQPINDPPEVANNYRAACGRAARMQTFGLGSRAGYTGGARAAITEGQRLEGFLVGSDEHDNNAPGYAPYNQSYASSSFHYRLVGPAQNGEAALLDDGSYTYTPKPGFTGRDSFKVLVEEAEGFAENLNPASGELPQDAEDVTLDTSAPLLARYYTVYVTVNPRAVPPTDGGADPGFSPGGATTDPAGDSAAGGGAGGPGSGVGNSPAGGAAGAEDGAEKAAAQGREQPGGTIDGPLPPTTETQKPGQEPVEIEAAAAPLATPPYAWALPAAILLVLLLLLLLGSLIRVRYYILDGGDRQRKTRYLIRRVHFRDEDEDYIHLTLPEGDFPDGTTHVHIHFGWLYRRKFYQRPFTACQGCRDCHTIIPDKDAYHQNEKGIRLLPGTFRKKVPD